MLAGAENLLPVCWFEISALIADPKTFVGHLGSLVLSRTSICQGIITPGELTATQVNILLAMLNVGLWLLVVYLLGTH